jgi:imidazoleglycerol phosphate dehydratase HisB
MIKLSFGDVRNKKIVTSNHFVSHMIEHIAWRSGLSIDLTWPDENWKQLGLALGSEIKKFPIKQKESSTLGMIDDGSAITSVYLDQQGVNLTASGGVDLDWFLGLRCEQIENGKPLVDLLEGISQGLSAKIESIICNVEDPHHTWEGVYRGLGICLNKLITPLDENSARLAADKTYQKFNATGEVVVLESGVNRAKVMRGTAETGITVTVDFSSTIKSEVKLEVDQSIAAAVKSFSCLFAGLCSNLTAAVEVDFKAKAFSSSHVVMEDIGLVFGRALLEIIKSRMENYGVNGAGSNIQVPEDISQEILAAVSIEGRKFWRFVPADGDYKKLKNKFLIGQNVMDGLRSEDLDDFIDGLAGGITGSIMIHVQNYNSAEDSWILTFKALGLALKEAFQANPYRRGVPPGVKATLS